MHVERVLRYVHPVNGFAYARAELIAPRRGGELIRVQVHPHRRTRPCCADCGAEGPVYDHLAEREFHFVPLWGIPVVLRYAMRRVSCPRCRRVVVERVPWSQGKSPLTLAFMVFLASWAKRMSWTEVGRSFGVGWDAVYAAVAWVVDYGKRHRRLDGIQAVGVDEIARAKGQRYLTLVYQIDAHCRRLLWIGHERTKESFTGFFSWLGDLRSGALRFVCSDMWRPYLDVIAERAPQALNILDRFHLVAKLGLAVDEVRRKEIARLRGLGLDAMLTKTRWIWLKKPRNLTRRQRSRRDLLLNGGPLSMNLRTVRAYLLRLDFEHLWSFRLPSRAGAFLDDWCRRVMRSRIDQLKAVARSFRSHRGLILNYFKAKKAFSSGVVEGLNNKAKLGMRRAYGIRGNDVLETVLFHQLGALPEPPTTHRFAG